MHFGDAEFRRLIVGQMDGARFFGTHGRAFGLEKRGGL
jgi:hypothetical protein